MPRGIYKRTKRQIEMARKNVKKATIAAAILPRSPKQIAKNKRTGLKGLHWKGGISEQCGYVIIYCPWHPFANNPKRYMREHRLIVEYFTKRILKPCESVHHINFVKHCNHPSNLMAFISESAHQRFENGKEVKKEEIIFDGRNLKEPIWR